MPTYIAMLRGVNVGGNMLKMERLREVCTGLGFANARTYVQSGNVVFETDDSASQCAASLEKKLARETRLPVTVIIRSAAEIRKVIAGNPFVSQRGIDHARLHVTFLAAAVTKDGLKRLSEVQCGADQYRHAGRDVYLHCPNGYAGTKLSNNALERVLAVRATTRNWNTVNKLHEMSSSG